MNLLLIDTTTEVLLLGLTTPRGLVKFTEEAGMTHAAFLAPKIKALLDQAGYTPLDLKALVVSQGPGSFTGLRIGLSTAKGLGEALGLPLAGVINLDALGWVHRDLPGPVLAVVDARKNRLYARLYQKGASQSEILDLSALDIYHRYKDLKLTVVGINPRDLFPASESTPEWSYVICKDWLEGLEHWGRQELKEGKLLAPGDGPYYHRMGEEDLGITPKKSVLEA